MEEGMSSTRIFLLVAGGLGILYLIISKLQRELAGKAPEDRFLRLAGILLDRRGLKRFLPHRFTALCLDGAIGYDPINRELKTVRKLGRWPFEILGHFPGRSLLPGHWQIELCCLSGVMLYQFLNDGKAKGFAIFRTVDGVKFKESANPGDQLEITVRVEYYKPLRPFVFSGEIKSGGKTIMTVSKISGIVIDKTTNT
jgi:3-hydroxymyristoyl/3-hydroxydecanoyl-(acyl carrier protein) dehydratase